MTKAASILSVVMLILILASCSSAMQMMHVDSNMRKIELGMTKKEVVSIMGKDFQVSRAAQVPDGYIEEIAYTNNISEEYVLRFRDGVLVEWFKKRPYRDASIRLETNEGPQR